MLHEILLGWALPFVCGALISGLGTAWRLARRREQALSVGVQCLLREQIIACYDRAMHTGFCPIYAKESLRTMYGAYHALGGNDVATALYETVMALPTDADTE